MATIKDKIILNNIKMEKNQKNKGNFTANHRKNYQNFSKSLIFEDKYKNSFNKSIEANHNIMLLIKKI